MKVHVVMDHLVARCRVVLDFEGEDAEHEAAQVEVDLQQRGFSTTSRTIRPNARGPRHSL